jgi:hypothetical protein
VIYGYALIRSADADLLPIGLRRDRHSELFGLPGGHLTSAVAPSARRPASVIRTRETSTARPAATTRSAFIVASHVASLDDAKAAFKAEYEAWKRGGIIVSHDLC